MFASNAEELKKAIGDNSREYIDSYVAAGNINKTHRPEGYTALMYAAKQKNVDLVIYLIQKGADIGKVTPGTAINPKKSALDLADGHEEITKILLTEKLSNIVKDQTLAYRYIEVINRMLADAGENANEICNRRSLVDDHETALIYSIRNGHLAYVREIIKYADISIPSVDNTKPWRIAIESNQSNKWAIAHELFYATVLQIHSGQTQIDLDFNYFTITIIEHDVRVGDLEAVRSLIRLGVNINLYNTKNQKPWQIAVEADRWDIAHMLFYATIQSNNKDYIDFTNSLLEYDIRVGDLDAIRSLIAYGANIDIANELNIKPWKIAVEIDRWDIVYELFNANIQYITKHKYDPNYLPELIEYTTEITKQTKHDELVKQFWRIINSREDEVIEIGNQKLLLLMQLLPHAVQQGNLLDSRIENSVQIEKIIGEFMRFNGITWDGSYNNLVYESLLLQDIWTEAEIEIMQSLTSENVDLVAKTIIQNNLRILIYNDHIDFADRSYCFSDNSELGKQKLLNKLLFAINKEYIEQNKFNIFAVQYFSAEQSTLPRQFHPFDWQLSIIQKQSSTNISLKPDGILLLFKKLDVFGKLVVYKINLNLQSWQIEQTSINAADLDPVANYYLKTLYLDLDEQEIFLSKLQTYSNVFGFDHSLEIITEVIKTIGKKKSVSLGIDNLWLDCKITCLNLLDNKDDIDQTTRNNFVIGEEVSNLLQKINIIIKEIEDLKAQKQSYQELITRIKNLESNNVQLNKFLQDLQEGIKQELDRIDEEQSNANALINDNSQTIEALSENIHKIDNTQSLYKNCVLSLSDNPGRLETNLQIWQSLKEQRERMDTQQATLEAQNSRVSTLVEQFNLLQPLLGHIEMLEKIINQHQTDEVDQEILEAILHNPYKASFYDSLVKKLNAIYLASSVVQTDILSSQKTGIAGSIGNIIINLSSHIPMVGLAATAFGTALSKLDSLYQERMLERFFNLVRGPVEMDHLAKNIARILLQEPIAIDYHKLSKPASLMDRAVNIFIAITESMGNIIDSVQQSGFTATEAVLTEATALLVNGVDKTETSTEQKDKLALLGAKHASLVASMIIDKIYHGDLKIESSNEAETKEQDIDQVKAELLINFVLEKYGISAEESRPNVDTSFANAVEILAAEIVVRGHELSGNLLGNNSKREEAFIIKLIEILSEPRYREIISKIIVKGLNSQFAVQIAEAFWEKEGIFKISHEHSRYTRAFVSNDKVFFGIRKEFEDKKQSLVFITKVDQIISNVAELFTKKYIISESSNIDDGTTKVYYISSSLYANELLNHPDLLIILKHAQNLRGKDAISKMIQLGLRTEEYNQFLENIDSYGIKNAVTKFLLDYETNSELQTTEIAQQHNTDALSLFNNNGFVNNEKGIEFLKFIEKFLGVESMILMLEIGQDLSIAEQILNEVNEQGIERVLSILFTKKIEIISKDSRNSQDNKSTDMSILETLNKIKNIIGEQELDQQSGFMQYLANALSNNKFSTSANKLIEIMGNLIGTLEYYLDVANFQETLDASNQIEFLLIQIENLFDFAASGQRIIGFTYRPPYFEPDYDPSGGYGSSGGNNTGEYFAQESNNDTNYLPIFFIRQNEDYNYNATAI